MSYHLSKCSHQSPTAPTDYTRNTSQIVNCLDNIAETTSGLFNTSSLIQQRQEDIYIRIVFMGDSRMRQQFYSFLRV